MTSYFLPDINAASTALPNKTFVTYVFIFHKQFYFVVSGLKIIGHGNPDKNLESLCTTKTVMQQKVVLLIYEFCEL
jgi:hypothetical protein